MMKKIFLSLFFALCISVSGQEQFCDGGFRLVFTIFAENFVEPDILYGQGTTIGGDAIDLYLDIYYPQGDTVQSRAVIIFLHGGPFSNGSRADIQAMCEAYAKRGAVAVSIDYRAFDLELSSAVTEEQFIEWLVRAVGDAKAAVRFFRDSHNNGNPYGIDPDRIVLGGVSAGAIVALHAGMVTPSDAVHPFYLSSVQNNGGWDGNSNDLEVSSDVVAVVSYSGGILDGELIDWNDPAFIAFHDDEDPIVPFESGFYRPDGETDLVQLEGTSLMAQRGESTGSYYEFVVNESDEHLGYFGNDLTNGATEDATGQFLFDVICEDVLSSGNPYIKEEAQAKLFPNPATDEFLIESTSEVSQVVITNSNGRTVATFDRGDHYQIDNLEKGLYFVMISFENEAKTVVRKIVKQ